MADIIKRSERESLSWPFSLFDDFFSPVSWFKESSVFTPALNVVESKENYEITAELPGLTLNDIEVSIDDDVLCLKGEKKFESEEKDKNYHRIERRYGSFQRSLRLPRGAQLENVDAEFENGILKIVVPKEEKVTKKIEISEKKQKK